MRRFLFAALLFCGAQMLSPAQQAPEASGARILILPRRVVAGDRATLAVLDVNGRLTPGVTINFSNGDRLTTDPTGRSLFVAPLNPGIVFASIANRSGRVPMVVLAPDESPAGPIEVVAAPRVASISDRFEIQGKGFCGGADENHVSVQDKQSLVLAASPNSLTLLPPPEAEPGAATVAISCNKREAKSFSIIFVELALEADSSPLSPGEHRALVVRVRGTQSKLTLEARNLAADIAELSGGNPVRATSSGGAQNTARFELVGRAKGSFLISIRLVAPPGPPK